MSPRFSSPQKFRYQESDAGGYLLHTAYAPSPMHRNRLAAIVKMLAARFENPSGIAVLDVGCGVGNISIPLASIGYHVHGIDIHEGSVEAARKKTDLPNIQFDAIRLEEIDLSKYDAVVLSEVLEHVIEAEQMFRLLAAGLKPGAMLILTVPNGWSLAELACRPSYLLKRSKLGGRLVKVIKRFLGSRDLTTANEQTPHVQFFRLGRLNRFFDSAGLSVESFHALFFAWPLWEIFFTDKISEKWARRDLDLSQRLPASVHYYWCFGLVKWDADRQALLPSIPPKPG